MINETIFENFKFKIEDEDLNPQKSSFWILLVALLSFVLWVIFLTFYLSRVTGLLVSFALNRLLRFSKSPGHVKVGSFSISLLSGKIMLKDFVYANEDFSLRCNDGWIIFSYWRFVPGKEIDHNDLNSRLHLSLNGVQLHWYNRVGRYKEIAKLFRLDEKIFKKDDESKRAPNQEANSPVTKWDRFWALVGAIRLDIWSGRCVVGNQLLPYMFDLSWENMTSKIKLCESAADRALLSIEGQMESVKASFVKHPDYDGPSYKDPPRTMGDGFDVLQSASLSFFYHQDILGFVTLDKQTTEKRDRPVWESIWRFGPNTVVSYGPWAEQQRALIYKFFFPPDYQTSAVTELPCKGQRRIHIMHDVRISFLKESSIDVWFMRGEQLESIYNRCQAGSSVDMSIWWITNEEGFSWSANFSLLKVVSTTSLLFRRLFECETMRIDCSFHYPRVFNAKQTWRFNYNVSKATMWFVWDHKRFFTDLINEWVGDAPSDLLQFIPYEVYTDLFVTDGIEVIMLLNNGNWVDPSEMQSENDEVAIVGEKFTLSFVLPFTDFLPETVKMSFSMIGENEMAMRFKYPSNSATAPLLAMLSRAAHVTSNAPKSTYGTYSNNDQWHECWRTEKVTVSFDYKFYPIVTDAKSSLPLHVLQEFVPPKPTHPKELAPDHLGVFIELDGSEVQFTGLLIRFILELKNNYFGYYDSMTDITDAEEQTSSSTQHHSMFNKVSSTNPQVELYRPMDVDVELKVHNIRAHVLTHSMGGAEPDPCPVFYTEELVMEMKKTYSEMVVQVAVGQCAAHFERASTFQPDGFLSLSGFQFRGQALLSPVEVPWDMAVVEYSWQIEILIGELKGSLELPNHVFALAHVIETILLFILSQDDEKVIPTRFSVCTHGQLTSYCTRSKKANRHCEGEDSVKYRQIRVAVDGAKLALCDDKNVIDVCLDPIRFTICNGHEGRFTEHICVRAPSVSIKQVMRIPDSHQWLEVAKIAVDGVALDIQLPLPDDAVHLEKARHEFIKKHDYSSRRLHFLYTETKVWECACFGKTKFFGNSDLIGKEFLSQPGQKLFIPSIRDVGQQPGVLQSLLRPNEKALRQERHRVYPSHRRNSADSSAVVSNSVDTGSFHSALSHQKDTRPSASRALMIAYSKYLSHCEIQKPASEPPKIGMPGVLTSWATNREVHVNVTRTGINAVQIQSEKGMVEATAMGTAKRSNEVPSNHLAIQGSVAHSLEIFISPLSIEMLEKLVTTIAGSIHKISPAALIQHTYLDCVIKSHRQPLTESLFTNSKRQLIVDVSLDLPRVHCSMFQCGLAEHHHALNENDKALAVSANICLALIDGATITSASDRNLHGTSFSLNCAVVNSQLLQVVSKAEADFSAARTPFRSSVNWLKSDIGQRLTDRELRVMMDLHIPDVVVTLEEKNKPMLFENGNANSTENSSLLTLENTTKLSIGQVKALVVMARPLEKTAKHEFPLYDALSPAITAWLNVAQRLDSAVERLSQTVGEWSDLSFARMMKLALECTDESILGTKGKHMMDSVKILGKHQNSCPTCLLLKILMRWYALPESAAHLQAPITVRCGFENPKTRKTALMALLSHWHPDICQMVKLASNFEAAKYRADPAQKKEVRINIDGNVTESRHRRNGSAASRQLAREAQAEQNETHSSKLDLYSYIRSAHRERNERKEGKKGAMTQPKDYVNPMDILPQAFFYSFYRMCRLDWTQLDGFFVDHLKLKYDITVAQIAVDLVEPKLLSSASAEGTQKLLAPCLHHLVTVKKIGLGGDLTWSIDMDEKNLMPIRGRAHLTYNGTVEDVQFVFAIASVCLAKEVILVVKAASDTLAELKKQIPSNPMTPHSVHSISAKSGNFDQQAWDEKVFDMMKDFEKNVQRSGAVQRGDVLTAVHGQLQLADIRLETRLTDLYVAFDMKTIELIHEHNPVPIKKSTVPHEIDVLRFKLRKAKLNIRQSLSEGAKTNESKPILHCGLKESNATLVRKHLVVDGIPPKVDTSLAISLGPIEGELPMSAGSLHDVVMKHGPQLEIELDRLSAQPQTLQEPGLLAVDAMSPVDHSWHKGPMVPPVRQKATQIVRVMFSFKIESVELKARILPSLLAMYRMKHASSTGETGGNAQWVVAIEHHFAEFHVSPVDKPGDSFTLDLPAIDVNGQYLGEDAERNDGGEAPATDRSLHYRKGGYLKMLVTLGRVNHSFTTELLNHILFAEQSFRTELSSLVSRISAQRTDTRPVVVAPPPSADKPPLLFFLTIKGTSAPKEPWLQLTAATPTATAVRFTIDTLETELTNRWVVREEGSSRERIFGCAVLQCSAKLGQLVKAAQYEEIAAELQEYATFMTQIRVENKESSKKSYSYHIALSRPILMIKSTAIDKAILLWLNYKNTYDYWRAERSRFEKSVSEEKRHSISQSMFSPQPSQDFDINLSLSINNGMYVCMPLISHDITDGMPALVLSLQKSDVSVSIKKELACQAQFHGFRLNFIDNFDEQSLMNFQETTTGEVMSNFFFFPQGSYKLCSKASNDSGDAKWVLSVRSHMRGMIIDLDQRIGKMAKMLVNTISSFGEDDDFGECGHSDYQPDSDEDLIDGANELATMPQTEQRIRWMEQKMHEQSRLVADLVMQRAGEIQLEAERKKLRQYELVRFKEFRRSMVEKLKRSNDKKTAAIKRPSQASMVHPPLGPKISSARSDDGGETRRAQDVVSMHIDVQVNIESGACTLRTAPKTDVAPLTKRPSAKDLRAKNILAPLVNFTKFSIPSVDLKGYYVSGVQTGPPPGFPMASERVNLSFREKSSKRGCFYLSIALASMPSETVVTPHLADFLEQVLEPLPIPTGVHSVSSVESIADGPEAMTNIVAIDTSVLPLDVIFHLSVQSSTIRFDGQQQRSSAADCLLKLPSLTLIGSTRRTDGAEYPGGVDISATLSEFSLSIYSPHQQSTAHDALSLALDHLSFVVSRSKNASTEPDNRVRFVLTSNIGTANFNYDMRRLSELLAFPKPWFRKAIARRVFFGDQTGAGRTPAASKQSTIASTNPAVKHVPDVVMDKPWSATVLLAVQWKELKVNAQMSNTMGTTSWIARKGLLRSLAKLNSRHERDITLTFKLDGSDLTAQGGAISGEVSLNKLGLSLTHKRFDKKPPRNKAVVELGSFATRIEWMSRVAIIGRCEHPSITLGDDFTETKNTQGDVTRVAVALNIKGSWDDLQIVITKTTIEDFIKIVSKLNNFFSEQLKNSRMVWKFDDEVAASSTLKKDEDPGQHDPPSHIGHWEQVLDLVTDIQYTLKLLVLPKNGETIVGGSVELEAKSCSLACMHGEMNANSWALFHLRNPSILFSPEAQFHYIDKANTQVGVSARQRLIIRLGGVPTNAEPSQTENMANVCRVQQGRNSVMRTNASIASSLDYLIGDVLKQIGLSASHTPTGPVVTKSQHSVLELFQFPALEAVLTSLQSMECDPDSEIYSPEVHSSFICEFHSAVYVQTDFNAQVSFLPELLKSYIHVHEEQQAALPKEEKPIKKDNRAYKCENWVVDPKIRFIDRFKWNPPVIDEVLRKLQIFDHRTTIPKALQRAVLDPLDAVLANGILQMLRLVDRSDYAKEQTTTTKSIS